MYSVTGETAIVTAPKVAPSGKFIYLYFHSDQPETNQQVGRQYANVSCWRQLMVAIDSVNCLVPNIPQNILFYVQQKKETHIGLEQLEGEYNTIFIFGWIIPLKSNFSQDGLLCKSMACHS